MSNKLKKKKRTIHTDEKQDSIFKEAWGNMNSDMAKIMPAFITSRLGKKGGKLWVMIVVTLLELVVLGVVGKLVYDWITK